MRRARLNRMDAIVVREVRKHEEEGAEWLGKMGEEEGVAAVVVHVRYMLEECGDGSGRVKVEAVKARMA